MKKILLGLVIFASCSNGAGSDDWQNSITEYLGNTLADPSTYESVSFSKLDTTWLSAYDSPQYLRLKENEIELMSRKVEYLSLVNDPLNENEDYNTRQNDLYQAKLTAIRDSMNVLTKSYKSDKMVGFHAEHTFRIKNNMGDYILQTRRFNFSPDKKITSMGE